MLYELGLKALYAYLVTPQPLLRAALARALEGGEVALCMHRVRLRDENAARIWETIIDAEQLDELIALFSGARLTVTFDDGYADAGEYVETRVARFPNVQWVLFVCPEKLKKRAGFRWDLPSGTPEAEVNGPPLDVRHENDRADLQTLGERPDVRLLTIADCQRIAKLPKVSLGNHTNCHFRQTLLSIEDSRYDMEKSRREFEELFGKTEHFAFPFGTPHQEFTESHVAMARELGYTHVWSTEPRPYLPEERETTALPRHPIFGTWPAAKNAFLILLQALRWRWQQRGRGAVPRSPELQV